MHVEHLEEKNDDDCICMPDWVFRELHSNVGDPVSVNFDSSLEEYEAFSVAEIIRLTPLTQFFLQIGEEYSDFLVNLKEALRNYRIIIPY